MAEGSSLYFKLSYFALLTTVSCAALQELYSEYKAALARSGSASQTLRIHLFLQAALQFEIAQEPEEDTIRYGASS
jgi:hypothetical protein